MKALWILFGAPCAGTYEAESAWPPPRTIRAVDDGNGYQAVLDLPDDVPLIGENVVEYELGLYGIRCGRGGAPHAVASYMRVGLAPQAQGKILRRAASGLEAVPAA